MSTQRPGMNVHGSVICNSLTETNINQQVNSWYIYTMEYYSAIQRNKLLRKKKSMNLRTVMLNEGSQTYDNHMHMIPYRILQNANTDIHNTSSKENVSRILNKLHEFLKTVITNL